MQNNPETSSQHTKLKDENQRLLSENAQLRKDLERETLYHKNLFIQWKELNDLASVKEHELADLKSGSRKGIPKAAFYSVLSVAIVLVVVDAYYLIFGTEPASKAAATIENVMVDSLPVTNVKSKEFTPTVAPPVSLPANTTAKEDPEVSAPAEKIVIQEPAPVQNSKPVTEKVAAAVVKTNPAVTVENAAPPKSKVVEDPKDSVARFISGHYKVRSKAFLYSKPDEGSRRNAFIIELDNAYDPLVSLDEKNGFIYIEFKNHLGQVSKGWVRKIDLDRI